MDSLLSKMDLQAYSFTSGPKGQLRCCTAIDSPVFENQVAQHKAYLARPLPHNACR